MVRVFSIVGSTLDDVQQVHYESVVYGHCKQFKLVQEPLMGTVLGTVPSTY